MVALLARLVLLPVILTAGLVVHADMVGGGATEGRDRIDHESHAADHRSEEAGGGHAGAPHSMLLGCLGALAVAAVTLVRPRATTGRATLAVNPARARPLVAPTASGLPPPGSRVHQGVLLRV